MDDRQSDQARKPQTPRFVTERQLRTTLDESLWEVERLRVDVDPPKESGWHSDLKGSAAGTAAETAAPRVRA
ncbi:MAG TPA: hypothetical protein VJU61_03445 [Polyangiaceae bacterium]|nr:hypothetical protein [Polyangiaceae bacterium]